MKRKITTVLALVLLAIPPASPYFLAGVPRTNDLLTHLYRTFALDRALRLGSLWPRWSPDLVHGYGYPVFNFFPSLSHWCIELVHLTGLPITTSYRVVVFLHFVLAAAGSYWLGRTLFRSRAAGWAAAVVYAYNPYLLYDAHVRGAAQETQALALLPWLILALWHAGQPTFTEDQERSIRQSWQGRLQSPAWILATAVLFALTFLSHPIVYQLMIPIGFWLLLRAWFQSRQPTSASHSFWQSLFGPVVGVGLGGLLTAFFWLPAFAEVQYTRADLSISQGYSYQSNFLSLAQMLRLPPLPADPALVNPPVVRSLPLVALLWAAVSLIWRWRQLGQERRAHVISWTAVLLLCVWLITPYSRFVWDHFPLLRLTFYPWRLLSMTALATAVLVALTAVEIPSFPSRGRRLLSVALLTILIVTSGIPWLYPPRETVAEAPDLYTVARSEVPPFFIGTTTLGEFLPRWVEELPDTEPLRDELIATGNPDRLQPADGLTWTRHTANPLDARYTIEASRPLTVTYRHFYFPGWQASLDGRGVDVTPSQPHGLITVPVPAGEHQLRIFLGTTGARRAGWAVTGLGAILWLSLAWWGGVWREGRQREGLRSAVTPPHLLLLGGAAVFLWLFFTLVDTPLRRPTLLPNGILGKPTITPLDYAGELRLLSYERSATEIRADEPIQLTLYWQPQHEITTNYDVGVQVVDEQGVVWNDRRTSRPFDWRFVAGDEPWPLDSYRMDPFRLHLLDGTPPGDYRFHVGLVRRQTEQTVAAHDLAGFKVTAPMQGERSLEEGMQRAGETAVSNNLRLLGSRLDRTEAVPGDPVRVDVLWQVDEGPAVPDNQFLLQLFERDGNPVIQQEVTIAPGYPVSQWQAGHRLRSVTVLRLPASTPSGEQTWRASWGDQSVTIDTLNVAPLSRTFDAPKLDVTTGASLGEVATLLGATVEPSLTAPSEVTLVWRAEYETSTSYRVFLHLLGPEAQIVAQSDGEPANWTRPTTGWLPGEIVLDRRNLSLPSDLPAGTYTMVAGLYDATSGQRLTTPEGQDAITLLTFKKAP